jgi:hypothetical protein
MLYKGRSGNVSYSTSVTYLQQFSILNCHILSLQCYRLPMGASRNHALHRRSRRSGVSFALDIDFERKVARDESAGKLRRRKAVNRWIRFRLGLIVGPCPSKHSCHPSLLLASCSQVTQ